MNNPPEFWHPGKLPDDPFGEVSVPPLPAALVRRIGNFPFWRGKEPFLAALEPIYNEASAAGMTAFLPDAASACVAPEDPPAAEITARSRGTRPR